MAKAELFTIPHQDLCPQCSAELVIRSGKHGPFLGCSAFPDCGFIRPLRASGDGHIVKILDGLLCPECGADKAVRQGRYGMFIACSHYPDCTYSEAATHSSSTDIFCPQCRSGRLIQRKSRFGKTFYACSSYPDCQYTLNFSPRTGPCSECDYPLLYEKKTAQGLKIFCASKSCGRQNLLPTDPKE